METLAVNLPANIVEKVKYLIREKQGLFEDEAEYITHCIIHYKREHKEK